MAERFNVVLVTYGEPPEPTFLSQFGYSHQILRKLTSRVAPIPPVLFPAIAVYRAYLRCTTWKRAGYRSPLVPITAAQAAALESALRDRGTQAKVHVAYEFCKPRVETVLAELAARRDETLVIFPVYAADSDFTTGFVDEIVAGMQKKGIYRQVRVIRCDDIALRTAIGVADYLVRYLKDRGWTENMMQEAGLILSAHGTLVRPPESIRNNGLHATIRYYLTLRHELRERFGAISIAWLNHVRGGQWTQPDLERVILRMKEKGIRRLAYYPFGFFADNAETELEGRCAYENHEDLAVEHVPCVNAEPFFISELARAVAEDWEDSSAV